MLPAVGQASGGWHSSSSPNTLALSKATNCPWGFPTQRHRPQGQARQEAAWESFKPGRPRQSRTGGCVCTRCPSV